MIGPVLKGPKEEDDKEEIRMSLDFKAPCKHTFSANEIRTASECARKRYYASRDCLAIRANKPAKALLLGGAIHTCLQYYYTELDKKIKEVGLAKPTLEDCQDLLDTIPQLALEGYDLLDKDSQKIYSLISEMYKEQIAVDLVSYEVISCELAFHMDDWPVADCMYHGFVDMVVKGREDDKIYFFEHKTCANFRPEIYDRFDIQLHIYAEYGKRYCDAEGCDFGGMILNQIKKAKTEKGYDTKRDLISYNDKELEDFYIWLKQKTEAVISPDNHHSPCNNYMTCKMCEYAPICLKYGYEVPQTTEEIINGFNEVVGQEVDADGNMHDIIQPSYKYDPRPDEEEEN